MADYSSLHLDENETVIMEVRKHWIVYMGHVIAIIVAAILPWIMFLAIPYFIPVTLPYTVASYKTFFLFVYIIWLLTVWAFFFIDWTKYYLDVWYVTQKRIIDVNQKRIFAREISNIRFDKIQDITIVVDGFLATYLDYGDLKVQTAAEDSADLIMTSVARPENVRKVIFSQHNEVGDSQI